MTLTSQSEVTDHILAYFFLFCFCFILSSETRDKPQSNSLFVKHKLGQHCWFWNDSNKYLILVGQTIHFHLNSIKRKKHPNTFLSSLILIQLDDNPMMEYITIHYWERLDICDGEETIQSFDHWRDCYNKHWEFYQLMEAKSDHWSIFPSPLLVHSGSQGCWDLC